MADFLSRLAERSLGTAAVVRPVIAPLFSTGPELASDAAEPANERSGLAGAGATPTRPDRGSDGPRPEPGGRGLEAAPGRSAHPDTLERRDADTADYAAAPRSADPRAAVAPPPIHAPAERPSRSVAVSPAAPEAREESRRPAVNGAPPAGPATGRAVPLLPRARPVESETARRPGHAFLPLPPDGEPPAPIVRISIGRIEVRAVAPPAVAPRPGPARTEARLSLEEYLRPGKRGR